jgi:hypothetical protein
VICVLVIFLLLLCSWLVNWGSESYLERNCGSFLTMFWTYKWKWNSGPVHHRFLKSYFTCSSYW